MSPSDNRARHCRQVDVTIVPASHPTCVEHGGQALEALEDPSKPVPMAGHEL
ncbi:hypothetical protein [Natrinema pallidum]|uniref:hypothetical protein n=1 Tax=Natrinema pallidum TaxID=69527 RepID=UPI000B2989DE|nr:hypothetical protein [Natrinema pallidum]